jgi:uncharacterized protein (DUF1330 family)
MLWIRAIGREASKNNGEDDMAKAYLVSLVRKVNDASKLDGYRKLAGPAMEAAGGRFIARGDAAIAYEAGLEGRTVIIEFDSVEAAIAAHDGAGYQEALKALDGGLERDIRIVEGLD